MPQLRPPVAGSFVITLVSVKKRPPSCGQHCSAGMAARSTWSPVRTTSCTGPSLIVFGKIPATSSSFGNVRTLSSSEVGIFGSRKKSSRSVQLFQSSTPRARITRAFEPNRLIATGIADPATRSNSSAGPSRLTTRSAISVISRIGETSAAIRRSSAALSRAFR